MRRELIDPVWIVLAAAASSTRVTVVRTPDRVRVSALGDGPGPPRLEFASRQVEVQGVVAVNRLWVEAVWLQGTPSR
ncbi:hypothetical protein ACWDRB_63685 [Nonomuraea sp. NPDC003707]